MSDSFSFMNAGRKDSRLSIWESALSSYFSWLYLIPLIVCLSIYFLGGFRSILVCSLVLLDLLTVRALASFEISAIGLEFGGLAVIISGIWFGPLIGGLTGFIVILSRASVGIIGFFVVWKLPGFILMGFLAGFLSIGIFSGGFLLLVFMRICFSALTLLISRQLLVQSVPFALTNIYLHYYIFMRFSAFVS